MLEFLKAKKKPCLEVESESVLKEMMAEQDVCSENYQKHLEVLERLNKLKGEKKSLSPDTILVVAANLLGIALILGYESVGNITSKALGFVMRGRV